MRRDNSKIRSLIAFGLVFFMALGVTSGNRFTTPVNAQGPTCFTVMSGNGNEGETDSQIQFFDGANWVPAFVIPPFILDPFSWSVIPGTHWVGVAPDRSGTPFTSFEFRTTFALPATYAAPSLTIDVHSDNVTTVFLNGHQIGMQPDVEPNGAVSNFQDPPESFTTTNPAFFVPLSNSLTFTLKNYADSTGLDFKATICYSPVQGCVDSDPPAISCNVAQTSLWPPNHQLETVGLTATVTDDCDSHVTIGGGPNASGVSVYSDEQDLDVGSGNFSPDAKNIGLGTLRLRSERGGPLNGRVYLIVVQATDASGKTGFCAKTVTVPHDQSKNSKQAVENQAAAARAYFLANHTPPPGFVQVGIGPIVGPKQ